MRLLRAGSSHWFLVLLAGFLLGTVRVLALDPGLVSAGRKCWRCR